MAVFRERGSAMKEIGTQLELGNEWFWSRSQADIARTGTLCERAPETRKGVRVSVAGGPSDARVLERYQPAVLGRALSSLPTGRNEAIERVIDAIDRVLAELHRSEL